MDTPEIIRKSPASLVVAASVFAAAMAGAVVAQTANAKNDHLTVVAQADTANQAMSPASAYFA